MKKWIPWLIGVVALAALIIRISHAHINELKEEKAWYIANLNYTCSARVDSIIRPGRALLHVTTGTMDPQREWQLKSKIRAHGILHLVISRDSLFDLRVPRATLKGDSLTINSETDQLLIYRNKKLVLSSTLTQSLRQRPF
jgi:hypothetical protein